MRQFSKRSVWLSSGLLLSLSATLVVASTSVNAYVEIAGSNVFRLQPPSRQEPSVAPPPLPGIIPLGITTILGDKRVLLKVRYPNRPPEQPKEVSCILTAGQREGPIEVLEIDETAGSVRVNNSGTIMLLTLDKDGPRQRTAPPPPGPPPPPPIRQAGP